MNNRFSLGQVQYPLARGWHYSIIPSFKWLDVSMCETILQKLAGVLEDLDLYTDLASAMTSCELRFLGCFRKWDWKKLPSQQSPRGAPLSGRIANPFNVNTFQTFHFFRSRMELCHRFCEIKVTSGDITLEATCQSFPSFRVFQVTYDTLSRFVPCSACCQCQAGRFRCSGFGLSVHCPSHRPVVPSGAGGMRSRVIHFWNLKFVYCSYNVNTSLSPIISVQYIDSTQIHLVSITSRIMRLHIIFSCACHVPFTAEPILTRQWPVTTTTPRPSFGAGPGLRPWALHEMLGFGDL